MARRGQNWKRILPGVIISLVSLAVIFYFVDFERLWQSWRLADYRLVSLTFLISLLWLMVRAFVWRTLLQEKAGLSAVFFTLNEGYLINNILPLRLGEVGRAFLLGRKAQLGFWQVFPTILIERALDVAFAAGLVLSTLPYVVGASWARQAAVVSAVVIGLGLLGLYLMARFRGKVETIFHRATQRWSFLDRLGRQQFSAFLSGLAVLTEGSRFLRAIFWMVINWGVAAIQYYIVLMAFFPQVKVLWALFSLGVLSLGIAAPSSPGALGVMEASMVGALSLLGLDVSTSTAAALTAHMANYVVTGILGTYALARDGVTLTSLYKDVQRIPPEDGN